MSLISIFLSYRTCAPVWRRPPIGTLVPKGPGQAFATALPSRYVRGATAGPNATGAGRCDAKRPRQRYAIDEWGGLSTPDTQALDQGVEALVALELEIVEQPAALADHL